MTGLAARANENRPLLGIWLILAAFFLFSFIDAGVKWLAVAGLPAMQLAFMRYLGHFVISGALIGRGGVTWSRFSSDNWPLVVVRGALLMGSTVLNFVAVRYLPLTLTSTILFSTPIIVCALSGLILGERVGPWRWSAIFAGFVGIVVAIRPFDESFHWAMILSIGAASCFSVYVILTRRLAGVVATDTMQFYSGLVGVVVLAPFAIVEWQLPSGVFDWLIMIMLGVFGWAGHELLTRAHGFAPASTLTPYSYSFIVYLTIWSALVFGQLPDAWTLAGGGIIVSSGLVIWIRERRLARLARSVQGYPA